MISKENAEHLQNKFKGALITHTLPGHWGSVMPIDSDYIKGFIILTGCSDEFKSATLISTGGVRTELTDDIANLLINE